MKFILDILITICMSMIVYSQDSSQNYDISKLAKNSNLKQIGEKLSGSPPPDVPDGDSDLDLGEGPFYWEGWVHYFKIKKEGNKKGKPTTFFKNMAFYKQMIQEPNIDFQKKLGKSLKFIPNDSSFYVLLTKTTLNILSSRKDAHFNTYDVMQLDNIIPILEGNNYKEGIKDIGKFSEGDCFKVFVSKKHMKKMPGKGEKKGSTEWIFCLNDKAAKNDFMSTIRDAKISLQRKEGIILTDEMVDMQNKTKAQAILDLYDPNILGIKANNGTVGFGNEGCKKKDDRPARDGKWIVISNWSQCSKKCGGGTSTLQRLCIPPVNGGEPCDGPAVVQKICNKQPCPTVEQLKSKGGSSVKKPIIKMMPISCKPQMYIKCVIKTSDAMMSSIDETKDKSKRIPNQKPVRIVMNNRTVTVFTGSKYENVVKSFELRKSGFFQSKNKKYCFIIKQSTTEAELCPFGNKASKEMFNEWDYHFNLFKYQCHTNKEVIELDEGDKKKLENDLKARLRKMKIDIVGERAKMVKDKLEDDKVKSIKKKIKATNNNAIAALKREHKLEKMIEKEEEEQENVQEKKLIELIEKEKDKKNCILTKIQEKSLEDQYNKRAREEANELKKAKEIAQKQIMMQRDKMKKKMQEMKEKSKRKMSELKQKLQTVRFEISQEVQNAYKKGSSGTCKKALTTDDLKKDYCLANFPGNIPKFDRCYSKEFCWACCENEFGDMFADLRTKCYNEICNINDDNQEGRWIWAEELNKIEDTKSNGSEK